MRKVDLPEDLEEEYQEIRKFFDSIRDDWKKYADEIIPQDEAYARRIAEFVVAVIDYTLDHFETVDLKAFQDFLAYYYHEFYYGPAHDDYNYLDFDETVNGDTMTEFCWNLRNEEVPITRKQLEKVKAKFERFISKMEAK